MPTNTHSSLKSNRYNKHLLSRLLTAGSRIGTIALVVAVGAAGGQTVPSLMNYQGKLLDVTGNPMPSGSYDVLFKISKKPDPADPADLLIWGQTNRVTVGNGIFNVVLGSGSDVILSANKTNLVDAFEEAQRYLSLTIVRNPAGPVAGPTEIFPRQQMLSAPFALKAAVATDAVNAYNGVPPGCILPFGGVNVPSGFLPCDGTAVSRSANSNLFFAIGTAWGAGDGFNTFNLPDIRGVFMRGVDSPGFDRDPDYASRVAMNPGGNTGRNVGSYQADEFKNHNHDPGDGYNRLIRHNGVGTGIQFDNSGGEPNVRDGSAAIAARGGSETRPRNVYVNYIIKY